MLLPRQLFQLPVAPCGTAVIALRPDDADETGAAGKVVTTVRWSGRGNAGTGVQLLDGHCVLLLNYGVNQIQVVKVHGVPPISSRYSETIAAVRQRPEAAFWPWQFLRRHAILAPLLSRRRFLRDLRLTPGRAIAKRKAGRSMRESAKTTYDASCLSLAIPAGTCANSDLPENNGEFCAA